MNGASWPVREVAPTATTVEILLSASPPGARIFLDGVPLASNPWKGDVPRDEAPHRIWIEAPGFVPWTDSVHFDKDRSVDIVLTGEPAAVTTVITSLASALEGGAFEGSAFEVLGPVPVDQPAEQGDNHVRALVRAPRAEGAALARALQAAQAGRSARKEGGGVRVQLDPPELS